MSTFETAASPTRTWKPVLGHEGTYEVSDQGEVRSAPRQGTGGGIRRATVSKVGYPKLELWTNGRSESRYVHHLVAEAFLGPRPSGHDIRHLDGNPLNCRLSNLAYGTRSENEQDKLRHGTNHNVVKTHCPHGHPYDAANTYVNRGRRSCRTCMRNRNLPRQEPGGSATTGHPNVIPGGN